MPTLDSFTPSANNLRDTRRQRHVVALLADAEFIRGQPDGAAKMEEAQRYIREAMLQHAPGRLSVNERDRILNILSFAVPTEVLPDRDSEQQRHLDDHAPYGPVA